MICFLGLSVLLSLTPRSQVNPDTVFQSSAPAKHDTLVNLRDSLGRRYGLWIEDKGHIKTYYKNDTLDGPYRCYDESGEVDYSGQYAKGKRTGTWYYYDESGHLEIIEHIISNNIDTTIYYSNKIGTTIYNGTIVYPYKSYVINYYPTGVIESEGEALSIVFLVDYHEIGIWKYYDERGNLIRTVVK